MRDALRVLWVGGALLLPATTDPYYALALGFGTGYGLDGEHERLYGMDFLVTADYLETPEGGPATYAAYVPRPVPHSATAPVTGLVAGRDGLIRPSSPDQPWRETIRVSDSPRPTKVTRLVAEWRRADGEPDHQPGA